MKRSFVLAALLLCGSLTSCQCANQPDVGPVDDEEGDSQTSQVEQRPALPVV